MTKQKKEILFLIGGAAIALIELIIIVVLLVNRAQPEKQQPRTASTAATTVATAATQKEEEPLPEPPPPYPLSGFTAEDFVMVDGFMTCTAADYMVGIDVSAHQGDIDWKQVKEAGIQFVIIRLGYRGYGESGKLVKDPMAQKYYKGAKEQGLLIGGYVFSQALDEQEAIEEAQLALEVTKDWEMDLPISFDWEFLHFECRTTYMEPEMITRCAKAFCETLVEGGRQPMLYTGLYVKTLELGELTQYPMWLALYSDTLTYRYWLDFWQYSCTGTVPGINGDVDLNIYLPKSEEPEESEGTEEAETNQPATTELPSTTES